MRLRTSGLVVSAALAVLLDVSAAHAQADFSGAWAPRYHEDATERGPGPSVGEYEGTPINDAGRARGDAWSASLVTVPEHQCIPHPPDYNASFGGLRFRPEVDPATQRVVAYRLDMFWMNAVRMIWMDGRQHPLPDSLHTWEGFSTGKWEGDVLTVTTTNLKPSYLRRNGLARSDKGTLTERFYRVGDVLTWVVSIDDPVYLTEPMVRSRDFYLDPGAAPGLYPCSVDVEAVRAEGEIPHNLPGKNPDLSEHAMRHNLPLAATRGGAQTMYPEYQQQITGGFTSGPKGGRR